MAANEANFETRTAESAASRLRMVNSQLRTNDVSDANLLSAFLAVPRESFVASAYEKLAYIDQDLPALGAASRKLLAPRTLGRLLQAAEVNPGDRALEVGGGSGYGAALLAELGAEATMLESDEGAAAGAEKALGAGSRVSIARGDLEKGAPGKAPFDVILVNGAFESLPGALISQLAERGRLVALDARAGAPRGVLIRRSGSGLSERPLFDASADVLPGLAKAKAFAF